VNGREQKRDLASASSDSSALERVALATTIKNSEASRIRPPPRQIVVEPTG